MPADAFPDRPQHEVTAQKEEKVAEGNGQARPFPLFDHDQPADPLPDSHGLATSRPAWLESSISVQLPGQTALVAGARCHE